MCYAQICAVHFGERILAPEFIMWTCNTLRFRRWLAPFALYSEFERYRREFAVFPAVERAGVQSNNR